MPYKKTYVKCAHCGSEFLGSKNKIWQSKKGKLVFCSMTCLIAKRTMDRIKSGNNTKYSLRECGPCPTCGKKFLSRGQKTYCSMKCYTTSDTFLNRVKAQVKKASDVSVKKRGMVPLPSADPKPCIECGKLFKPKPRAKTKYCSFKCYRLYMSKRFDRWIASPQTISLPQNYDEFLTSNELACLVEGCGWRGQHLSAHMNFEHGVQAADFKRASGFNLSSGIVSLPLHEVLCDREHIKHAVFNGPRPITPHIKNYISKESVEHHQKSAALRSIENEIIDVLQCPICGEGFEKKGLQYSKKYCSVKCRSKFYYNKRVLKRFSLRCSYCGETFDGSVDQLAKTQKGDDICCSHLCAGKIASEKRLTTDL